MFYKHWPMWKTLLGVRPTPAKLAELEAQQLAFEVLQRELQLIDDRCSVEARKNKIAFIQDWLGKQR